LTALVATVTAYDANDKVSHRDMREYPDGSLLWEHVGCEQNNRKAVRVIVQTDTGLQYQVEFSPWTPNRRFAPSPRFLALLRAWGGQLSPPLSGKIPAVNP
jgi:hypothetical protein